MAYLKPQSPIKKDADYIYPLTTYDQIIMPDGSSRWDGKNVKSVNGKTGDITLTTSDIGLTFSLSGTTLTITKS